MQVKLSIQERSALTERIQVFFEEERSESIGSIAAEQLLDYMLAELGPYVYNEAIKDARKTVMERVMSMEDELFALEKRIEGRR